MASGGLTLNSVDTLGPRCDAYLEKAGAALRSRACSVACRLACFTAREPRPHLPGPTCALALTDRSVVGLDQEAYVTSVGEAFEGGGFPALTGISIEVPLEGRKVCKPAVTVGLAVVKAFKRHRDLFKLLSEVNVSELDRPRAILKGGTIVEMGAGRYAGKVDRLHQVLLQMPHLDMYPRRVDLRFSRQVIVEYSQVRNRARKEV